MLVRQKRLVYKQSFQGMCVQLAGPVGKKPYAYLIANMFVFFFYNSSNFYFLDQLEAFVDHHNHVVKF